MPKNLCPYYVFPLWNQKVCIYFQVQFGNLTVDGYNVDNYSDSLFTSQTALSFNVNI